MEKLDTLLQLMVKEDSSIKLLPVEIGTEEMSPKAVLKLEKQEQTRFIKLSEGTRKTYIDAFLHIKSLSSHQKIKGEF